MVLVVLTACTVNTPGNAVGNPATPDAGAPDALADAPDASADAPPPSCTRPSASDVLTWLTGLRGHSANRIVSGFFGGYSGTSFALDQTTALTAATGQAPGILSCDYGSGWNYNGTPADYSDDYPTAVDHSCNSALTSWWQQDGLASVSVHSPTPGNVPSAFRVPLANFADLGKPATPAGARWHALLDEIANGLAELRAAGVPVLFRPLHEMNGNWFWWGASNPTAFVAVWREMHAYLRTVKGLDNLIWVFAPDCNAAKPAAYYPGDAYVDIVALDCYTADPSSAPGYDSLTALGKPVAFSEIGPPSTVLGSFDYQTWIQAFQTRFTAAIYFLAWNDAWSPLNNRHATELMTSPLVVNQGEIGPRACPR
jgi:mannan endo-1,4-beta-mannosidase